MIVVKGVNSLVSSQQFSRLHFERQIKIFHNSRPQIVEIPLKEYYQMDIFIDGFQACLKV